MQVVYNWHITEKCNYSCEYCFSDWCQPKEIWKNIKLGEKILLSLLESKDTHYLQEIKGEDCYLVPCVNFAGGEPLILGNYLIEYAKLAKSIGLETSLITNGSLILNNIELFKYIDMVGISIDSFDHDVNCSIGRCSSTINPISKEKLSLILYKIREENPKIKVKFNTVVSNYNWNQKIIKQLLQFDSDKIKIFRQLQFGDNNGISDQMFEDFLRINNCNHDKIFIENNNDMEQSYLMIDPSGRLFQNTKNGSYNYSLPIHEIGVEKALSSIQFNIKKYQNRYRKVER